MEKSEFYGVVEQNLGSENIAKAIKKASYNEALKQIKAMEKDEKLAKIVEIFSDFSTDLEALDALVPANLKALLSGLKEALVSEEEENLYNLIYEFDRLKKQTKAQKDEIKSIIISGFSSIEESVKSSKFTKRSEMLSIINESLVRELDMKDVLKEVCETAFLSTIESENFGEIKDTAHSIAKNISYHSIIDGEFSTQRVINIAKIILTQAINIANESKIYANDLISGAVEGVENGISKSIEKFKNDLKFAPEEIIENLSNTKQDLAKVEDEFIALLRVLSNTEGVSREILDGILQKDYDSYFAKLKRIANDASEQISEKLDEIDIDELGKNMSQKFDEFRKELSQKGAEFKENLELDEKIANFKREFGEFEKKIANKISEFKNRKAKEKEAKEMGERAYKAAKDSLEEESK